MSRKSAGSMRVSSPTLHLDCWRSLRLDHGKSDSSQTISVLNRDALIRHVRVSRMLTHAYPHFLVVTRLSSFSKQKDDSC